VAAAPGAKLIRKMDRDVLREAGAIAAERPLAFDREGVLLPPGIE
jgi:hypothetical protein